MRKFFYSLIVCLATLSCAEKVTAQTVPTVARTIRGVVKSKGLPMVGVVVIVKDSYKGTVTDADGKYVLEFPDLEVAKKSFPVVVFSFLKQRQEYEVTDESREIELNVDFDPKTKKTNR